MPQLRGFASIARQNPAVAGHASSATVFFTTGVALRDLNAVLSMVELKDDPCRASTLAHTARRALDSKQVQLPVQPDY